MSVMITESVTYDVTVDFNTDGVGCIVWRKHEDEDFIDVTVTYEQMLQQMLEYNTVGSQLKADGIETFIETRDALQQVVLRMSELITEGTTDVE